MVWRSTLVVLESAVGLVARGLVPRLLGLGLDRSERLAGGRTGRQLAGLAGRQFCLRQPLLRRTVDHGRHPEAIDYSAPLPAPAQDEARSTTQPLLPPTTPRVK